MQLFIQSNWLGLNEVNISSTKTILDSQSKKNLVLDGECIYATIKHEKLLLVAKTILYDFRDHFTQFKVNICLHCFLIN